MKVLNSGTGSQTIKIIPREYVTSASLIITDDQTNASVTYSVSPSTDKNYLVVANNFTTALVNEHFYDLELQKTDGTVIYRDKIFVTSDTTSKGAYSINTGVYTTDATFDNDYIVLE
tara:strand:+ start:336 stop:686 length:351 start_codon:yes stop_codon:yes gene_type:complete